MHPMLIATLYLLLLLLISASTQSLSTSPSPTSTSSLSSLYTANMLQDENVSGVDSVGVGPSGSVGINQSFAFHLLHNEKIYMNLTQVLNISAENLTTLLINVQNNITDVTEDDYMPEGGTPMALLITLTICYALIFIAGVLGNLITCIVISRNNFMHTATNFYLFNLAVSDLILLLSGMPQELYNLWNPDSYPFTDVFCIMGSVLAETAANATVLTITAFTVERYIAICHPFRQHTMSKLSRAVKFIFAIWLMALLLALPQAMQFSVMPQEGGYSCTMENDFYAHVFAVSGFIFFGGPMTAICVLYVLIGVKLKRSRLLQSLPRRSYDINRSLNAQTRVIRMLVAVAVAFFLCWAPFHAQRLMAVYGLSLINFGINREDFYDYFRILDYTSGVLYFLSTCINPLLYNIMSHKFREAFKITLTRQFGLASKHQNQHHNYSALLRQNGSMRLHTTVNNNALEHFGSSYRVVQFRCREPGLNLSLQDSIRTTTTTTTITSTSMGCSGGSSRRSSHQRNHCVAMVAKSDLPNNLTRSNGNASVVLPAHRMLQTQISQMSSVGDANSLIEADVSGSHDHYPSASYRAKRALLATSTAHSLNGKTMELVSSVDNEPTTVATHILRVSEPTRSRLKLSRIITRREHEAQSGSSRKASAARVELIEKQLPIPLGEELVVQIRPKTNKKLENLAEKLQLKRHKSKKQRQRKQTKIETQTENAVGSTKLVGGKGNHEAMMGVDLTTECGNENSL